MKQCPNCGKQLDDNISFCPECGRNITNVPSGAVTSNNPDEHKNLRGLFDEPKIDKTGVNEPPVQSSDESIPQPPKPTFETMQTEQIQSQNYSYGQSVNTIPNTYVAPINNEEDKTSIGLCILSWLVPLFGWIYWGVKKSDYPHKAKSCGIAATISFALNLIISIIFTIVGVVGAGSLAKTAMENPDINYSWNIENQETEDSNDDSVVIDDDSDKKSSSETKESSKKVGKLNWNNVVVNVNGANIELPCSYKSFIEKTGLKLEDPQDAEQTLKTNNYVSIPLVSSDSSQYIYVGVINDSNSVKSITESKVYSINDSQVYGNETDIDITYPNNFKVGQKCTVSQIKEILGEPNYVYNSDDSDYHTITYEANESSYYQQIEFVIDNNNIIKIDLENFPQ